MSGLEMFALACGAALMAYLFVALLKPEWFS
ncbi:MAG: K(+)-transporting ATPase subunit F [Gemmataceae bacterium]|nr:K(+)-transporting ATPase subunit F [Gemmataceae bacterium]